jgi:hypothetical protein
VQVHERIARPEHEVAALPEGDAAPLELEP